MNFFLTTSFLYLLGAESINTVALSFGHGGHCTMHPGELNSEAFEISILLAPWEDGREGAGNVLHDMIPPRKAFVHITWWLSRSFLFCRGGLDRQTD